MQELSLKSGGRRNFVRGRNLGRVRYSHKTMCCVEYLSVQYSDPLASSLKSPPVMLRVPLLKPLLFSLSLTRGSKERYQELLQLCNLKCTCTRVVIAVGHSLWLFRYGFEIRHSIRITWHFILTAMAFMFWVLYFLYYFMLNHEPDLCFVRIFVLFV